MLKQRLLFSIFGLFDVSWLLPRYLLCFTMLGQGTPLQNLLFFEELVLNKDFPQGVRFKNMSKRIVIVRRKGGPKLRGKAIKVRNFGSVVLNLWARFYNPRLAIPRMIDFSEVEPASGWRRGRAQRFFCTSTITRGSEDFSGDNLQDGSSSFAFRRAFQH